jgi:hypothetical protein
MSWPISEPPLWENVMICVLFVGVPIRVSDQPTLCHSRDLMEASGRPGYPQG